MKRKKIALVIGAGSVKCAMDSPLRYAFQLSSIMTNSIFKARLAFHNLAHHAEILLLLPQFRQRIGLFDTDKFPAIITAGEEVMMAQQLWTVELAQQRHLSSLRHGLLPRLW